MARETSPLAACLLAGIGATAQAQVTATPVHQRVAFPGDSLDTLPTLQDRDWVYCYWPKNFRPWPTWPAYSTERYVNSGFYAMSFDVTSGAVTRLGSIETPGGSNAGLMANNAEVESLPAMDVTYRVDLGSSEHPATSFLGEGGHAENTSRLIDGGRFLHRLDIPEVSYESANELSASVVLTVMPRHWVLSKRVHSSVAQSESVAASMTLEGAALTPLSQRSYLDGSRAVRMTDENGDGWIFIVPEVPGTTANIEFTATGGLTASRSKTALAAGEELAVSLLALPTDDLSEDQLQVYLHPGSSVRVQFAQLDRDGVQVEALEAATFDPERGAYLVSLDMPTQVGAPLFPDWSNPTYHTWYNRHKVVLEGDANASVSIPIALDLEPELNISSITGGSALFRNSKGEPVGLPLQISKNWHETNDYWYHFYAVPHLQNGARHELEFTQTTAKWGAVFAASHAQLSLVGWGTNQQWDESALACWGESVTYDPDLTLQRSTVDDVRPFLVQSNAQYNWTGNIGGAQFLTYWPKGAGPDRFSRMRTQYNSHGPNLTDVTYAGKTLNGKIEGKFRTRLGRTDDLVRVFYDLDVTFLEEVSYNRLSFFQVAADNYSDNDFSRLAYGNADAVTYDQPSSPTGSVGYASASDRGIALTGDAPWVLLYSNLKTGGSLPEEFADVGFVVRNYELDTGDALITEPHINLVNTNNWNLYPEVGFELGAPYNASDESLPAGTRLRATVEYLVLPADKSRYYGPSADLLAVDSVEFGTPQLMQRLAAENRVVVQTKVGELLRTHPIEIAAGLLPKSATAPEIATQFSLEGGFGFVAVVIRDLDHPEGWRLERLQADGWTPIGQEVEGNDYWQADFDSNDGSWSLTFNLDSGAKTFYRLIRD